MNPDPRPRRARRAGPLKGCAVIPGDKSISQRAIILGGLAAGETRISGLLESGDVHSTAGAVRALGATVRVTDNNPVRSLLAIHDGFEVGDADVLASGALVISATGVPGTAFKRVAVVMMGPLPASLGYAARVRPGFEGPGLLNLPATFSI